MKVCLYIRLSSADKDLAFKNESESITNQRALLHQYLRDHKEFFPYETIEFVDDGYSGTNGNRPAFEKMIEFLRDGGAKLVLCKDLSRFFRDYVEIGDYLERIFPFLGVRFIAVNDGYDSNDYKGTTGGMDVVMKCIVYGFYSKDLSQKIKTVLNAKMKKGQFIGAFAPYGFLKDPEDKHHLIRDPVAAPIVHSIFNMAIEGKTTGEIAKVLNAAHVETPSAHFHRLHPNNKKFLSNTSKASTWNCGNVYEILKRREYTGANIGKKKDCKTIDNPKSTVRKESDWIIVRNCHEEIVSEEEFLKAQNAIGKYTEAVKSKLDYPLRSLVHCGICGRIMTRKKPGKTALSYYYCDKNRYIEDSPCPIGERFYESDLEKIVIASLSQTLQVIVDEDKRLQEAAAKSKGTTENLRRNILRVEQAIQQRNVEKVTAYERYRDGAMSRNEFLALRQKNALETETLEKEKAMLEGQLSDLLKAQETEAHALAEASYGFLSAGNVTNQMLMTFIEKVLVYTGGRVEIVYRFKNPFGDSEEITTDTEETVSQS